MTKRIAIPILVGLVWFGCGDDGTTPTTSGDAGPDSGTDTDTSTSTDYDCAALPQGPFEMVPTEGVASKDVAFDDEGNLVGSDYTKIYKTTFDGDKDEIADNIASCTGIRYLPNGSLVFAEELNGTLVLLDVDGEHEVMSSMHSPRGIAVDMEGLVYIADPPMNRIKRVDPYTFVEEVVVDELPHAAVMAFDADYERLFIATKGEDDNTIYVVDVAEDGTVGEVEVFATDVGDGWHVGLAVDACGNLYVVEHWCGGDLEHSCIFRVSADGVAEQEPIAEIEGENSFYISGIEWGSGIGGWEERSLYVGEANQDSVYRIDIGVPSKPRVFP